MNNYPIFKNYNYTNSNMMNDMTMYNNQKINFNNQYNDLNKSNTKNSLFDPYNGLIRGNLFKNLYDPYINNEPYEIKPMNEQAKLLTYIDSLSFAMVD